MIVHWKTASMVLGALILSWGTGWAETPAPSPAAAAAKSRSHDPPVADVVREALRYFRVHPDAIDSLRTSARTRALLPLISGGFRYDDDKFLRNEVQGPSPLNTDENTNRKINSFSVGAVWDFRETVFNPAEVQVYGLIGIQKDLILEVTRTYYLRQQLILLRTQKPPEDQVSLGTLDLRIEEYTSTLDVLTGGWFSHALSPKSESKSD